MRDGTRRGAQALAEHPPQVSIADLEPVCQASDAARLAVEGSSRNERHRTCHQILRRARRRLRGALWPASQARSKARQPRLRGRRVEGDVLGLWRLRRADGPAVDPGQSHGAEELPVESRITRLKGPVCGAAIQFHVPIIAPRIGHCLAGSGPHHRLVPVTHERDPVRFGDGVGASGASRVRAQMPQFLRVYVERCQAVHARALGR